MTAVTAPAVVVAASPLILEIADAAITRSDAKRPFTLKTPIFQLAARNRVALVGPSGSGKTTMLDLLALIARPARALRFWLQPREEERIDIGEIVARRPQRYADATAAIRARHVAYIPQRGGLMPFLTARENILAGAPASRRRRRLSDLAEALKIGPLLEAKPGAMSVGEQQRVALARALIRRPTLVLADEPTAALDPELSREAMRLLISTTVEEGAALVVATHDDLLAREVGLEFAPWRAGRTEEGASCSVFERPAAASLLEARTTP